MMDVPPESDIHTVREWLESFGISVSDEFFLKWQQVVLKMGTIFRSIKKELSQNVMKQVWNAAFVGLYLSYDLEKEFWASGGRTGVVFSDFDEQGIDTRVASRHPNEWDSFF